MNNQAFFKNTILEGKNLILTPLTSDHIKPLAQLLFNPEGFFEVHRGYNTVEKIEEQIHKRLVAHENHQSFTYVFFDKNSNELVGMSSFMEPANHFKRVEISFTWICPTAQKSYVNRESKILMLEHAFKTLGVCRVEFSVDPANEKSNKAMLGLGAKLDGTMRKWRFNSPIDKGDRNIYSILDTEFDEIKKRLS